MSSICKKEDYPVYRCPFEGLNPYQLPVCTSAISAAINEQMLPNSSNIPPVAPFAAGSLPDCPGIAAFWPPPHLAFGAEFSGLWIPGFAAAAQARPPAIKSSIESNN